MTIDESLAKLEEITKRLEEEGLPLEEAVALFEEGIALAARIKTSLDEARLTVRRVVEESQGVFALEDFDLP